MQIDGLGIIEHNVNMYLWPIIILQNYTNMMVDDCGIQTFEVMVVVLFVLQLFLTPQVHLLSRKFGQVICPNILKC